jgi:hypothetical protein
MTKVLPGKIQLELDPMRSKEVDRNFHLGGRSFYFFDFDDNVAFMTTPLVLFHKENKTEVFVSTDDWAHEHMNIGKQGPYRDYEIDFDDRVGSFRYFRDHDTDQLKRLGKNSQTFVHDMAEALGYPDLQWQGPSWSCFYHATFNQRPVSVITARGHGSQTIKDGIRLMVEGGHLPMEPNYLSVYPVTNPETRLVLGDSELLKTTAELKQIAIRASVETALRVYGYSPHHRFGMSDDDPKNIQLISEEMTRLKNKYPEMSFFMIETQKGNFIKNEITLSGVTSSIIESAMSDEKQTRLF